ncbi:MAG: hypothetical protein LM581_01255 [Desulfurococcales archaeon]|nr:hypothetical protein [Desulfurococcales archaeon]
MSGEEDEQEDVETLLKRLLDLSSVEAYLHFKLSQELEEARAEIIRLVGLFSICELSDESVKMYRHLIEDLINKYVMEVRRGSSDNNQSKDLR